MQTQKLHADQFEFYFANLDTLVLVENGEHEVVIRATRNTFSESRKLAFIHELAAEGFIPESYRWFSSFTSTSWPRVRWAVEMSWLTLNPIMAACANRFMIRALLGAGLLWLAMMAMLFLRQ
jgi:hypothetical protein